MNRIATLMRSYYLVCSIVLSSLILPLALKADSKKEMFELACNDLLHISLDTNCTATITANMVLEDMIGLATDYTIKVYLNNVLQSDLLFGSQDINKIFDKGFTGKENHTGLGLWEIRKILKRNNNLNLHTTKTDKYFTQQFEIYNI